MRPLIVPLTCRNALAGSAAVGTATLLQRLASIGEVVSPFKIETPEATLTGLRHQLRATSRSDRQNVPGDNQGAPFPQFQALIDCWVDDYDWRKAEAKLNALPRFITKVDGLAIQRIHIRSRTPFHPEHPSTRRST